jgi:hypothetical protein
MTIHLTFRRGQKENWNTNYNVKFHFDYDTNLEKKVKAITFHNLDLNQKLTIPWVIFSYYTEKEPLYPFIDSSGLRMWFKREGGEAEEEKKTLVISDSKYFNLLISKDQIEMILRGALRAERDFSTTVENTLKEFISRSV